MAGWLTDWLAVLVVYPIRSLMDSSLHRVPKTYTRELGTAVTALGGSSALLDVQSSQLTTGGLDDAGEVGGGVVAISKVSPSISP